MGANDRRAMPATCERESRQTVADITTTTTKKMEGKQ